MALYALYDSKAESFLPLMEASNDSHAQRLVADAIQQVKPIATHPADYALWKICDYDTSSGYVTQDTRPSLVCSVLNIMSEYYEPKTPEIEEYINGQDTEPVEGATPTTPE